METIFSSYDSLEFRNVELHMASRSISQRGEYQGLLARGCADITMWGLTLFREVVPPKTIIFFGPPGTGKTHFAKAIAGALSWWFIEIASALKMM
jgi:ATP-dependent Lon protease